MKEDVSMMIRQEGKAVIHLKDEDGQTSLHIASSNGHEDLVALLLKNKADIDAVDGARWTALHCAASIGNLRICEMLLKVVLLNFNLKFFRTVLMP